MPSSAAKAVPISSPGHNGHPEPVDKEWFAREIAPKLAGRSAQAIRASDGPIGELLRVGHERGKSAAPEMVGLARTYRPPPG